MKIFHKKDDTIGITLYRRKNKAVELWYTKPWGDVEVHYHEDIDSKIVHLFGGGILWKGTTGSNMVYKFLGNFSWFHLFNIPAGLLHSVSADGLGFLFINIETLKNGSNLSAAQDYHVV